jgi:hypothetical protein
MLEDNLRLTVHSRAYSLALLGLVVGFITVHCGLHYYHHHIEEVPWLILQLFELDEENNLPTWFSSFLLLNVALLMFAGAGAGRARIPESFLAAGFLLLSVDEVAGLHETLNTATDINWAIPGGVLVLVLGAFFIPYLRSLEKGMGVLFILCGLIYVSGAVGIELLSEDMDEDSYAYSLATACEEGLEMVGVWAFLTINLLRFSDDKLLAIDIDPQ